MELPSLLVYETIDLYGPHKYQFPSPSSLLFAKDPEYPDTLYISHSHGAHSLSLQSIFKTFFPAPLQATSSAAEREQLQKAARKESHPEVSWLLRSSPGDTDPEEEAPVIFLEVVNDVYLGYILLILTADMQLITMELTLRSIQTVLLDDEAMNSLIHTNDGGKNDPLSTTDKKSYIPFSDSLPFTLPNLLTKKTSIAPRTRLAAPPSSSRSSRVASDGQIELTIDSLRFVGQTVERLDTSIRELIQAGNTVQERLELHLRELPRQVSRLQDLDASMLEKDKLVSKVHVERLMRVKDKQKELEKKADRILQQLIDNSQPELSAFERKWMEELERVRDVVQGQEERSTKGLNGRLRRLVEQLELLKPQLGELQKNERGLEEENLRMGDSQRKRIEAALTDE